MTKNETTMAIEKSGKKIDKEIIRNPKDKGGTYQKIAQDKEEIKQEIKEEGLDEESMKVAEKKQGEKPKEEKPVHKKPKKTEAVVRARNIPVSTKHSMAIGKFIRGKKIDRAISDLEQVLKLKKAVPMKGEIPHRHGKGMMSGRFPKKTSETFIRLLKSLSANAQYNELEEPIISEVVSNIGERPFGRFGAVRKKRTHIKIVARNKDVLREGKK